MVWFVISACEADQYKCGSGECIDTAKLCDGYDDCIDVSDEINCAGKTNIIYFRGSNMDIQG